MKSHRPTIDARGEHGVPGLDVVDSHTGGEPTRLVVGGTPDLGGGPVNLQLQRFRTELDHLRSAVVNEPRGSDVLVGAVLCPPHRSDCSVGVFFFNNVGYLGMCGHGTIGVAVTLARLGRLAMGTHLFETPVGVVRVTLHDRSRVSVENVPSYRYRKKLALAVPGIGTVHGDIAWGGNWFFLVEDHGQALAFDNVDVLTGYTKRIRHALDEQGVRGRDGGEIDHVELFGPPTDTAVADSRNFVLCPGGAYDRSPCGTGTSAKAACLFDDGKLRAGDVWRQQGITGSVFECTVREEGPDLVPTITGTAYVTAQSTLLLDPDDPFRFGLRAWP